MKHRKRIFAIIRANQEIDVFQMVHLIVQPSETGSGLKESDIFYLFKRKLQLKIIGSIKALIQAIKVLIQPIKTLQLFVIALIDGINYIITFCNYINRLY
jgi:hypothetical protein